MLRVSSKGNTIQYSPELNSPWRTPTAASPVRENNILQSWGWLVVLRQSEKLIIGLFQKLRLGQDLLELTLGLIKFELMTDINSSFIDWLLNSDPAVNSNSDCSAVLGERRVVHGRVMVAHTELWWSVHRQELPPLASWWCFHGFLSLTVQKGEVRVETDLNLPQNLNASILLKQKYQMSVSLQMCYGRQWIFFYAFILVVYLWMNTLDFRCGAVEILQDSFNLWKLQTHED